MELKFLDEKTTKSVRKFLSYGSGLIFFASCIYTMIVQKGPLDMTQYIIIAGVIGFYYGKDLLKKTGIKIVTDKKQPEQNSE